MIYIKSSEHVIPANTALIETHVVRHGRLEHLSAHGLTGALTRTARYREQVRVGRSPRDLSPIVSISRLSAAVDTARHVGSLVGTRRFSIVLLRLRPATLLEVPIGRLVRYSAYGI